MSHPVRVRGLKLRENHLKNKDLASHPVRVRGLKLHSVQNILLREWSHPVRVRGLKLFKIKCYKFGALVAPRAGAWIETAIP